jgi:hypothetical protein
VDIVVTDAAGKPISDLAYSLAPVPPAGGIGIGGATDHEGRLRATLLAGARYRIALSPSVDAPYTGRQVITIPEGRVAASRSLTIVADECLQVRGVVRDPSGAPVANMRILCSSKRRGGSRTAEDARTNAKGEFSIPFVVGKPPYIVHGKGDGLVVPKRELGVGRKQDLVLHAQVVETLTLQCRLTSEATGAVFPFTGLAVLRGPVGYRVSIADGMFTLSNLVRGRYELRVEDLRAAGHYIPSPSFLVTADTKTHDFVVAAIPTTAVVVRDSATGEPVAGARVFVTQTGRFHETNEQGRVSLRIPQNRISVDVRHAKYEPNRMDRIEVGTTVEVKLKPTVSHELPGNVVDAEGKPVPGALVTAFISGVGVRRARTDKGGHFLLRNIAGNKAKVLCRAEGLAPSASVVSLPAAGEYEVRLRDGAKVSFVLTDGGEASVGMEAGDGAVLILDGATGAPMGGFSSLQKARTPEVRLLLASYALVLSGPESAFLLDVVQIEGQGQVRVDISIPNARRRLSQRQLKEIIWSVEPPRWLAAKSGARKEAGSVEGKR